uniref:zinc finger CCCH domain-containing protein 14-like n=1 Tax=Erigeron canadensis TaxID=72917 RepID=UPI001CB8D148|nr:zinc finger CCCH domain-containing protein 14-like [Erigeron canadensis]
MEKNKISSSEITADVTGVNNDNNNNVNDKILPSNLNDNDELIDQFDFSSGELFNPIQVAASSIFPPKFILQSQLSFSSPSDCSFDDDAFSANAIATENRLNQASFILEYQQLYNSYTMCLTSLQDSVREVEILREQNEALRMANGELMQQLSMFSRKNGAFRSQNLIGDFSRLSIGSPFNSESNSVEKVPSVSPTSVIDWAPNSISVRSKGYLKPTSSAQRPRRQQPATASSTQPHRLHVAVAGEKKAGGGLEFEVYNQGMSKTELCNKWKETGACPYGDNCHFAHGASELRPVIRHPRYKTEVCRMVLSGDICPYGHRCHFRHTLTDEEMPSAVNPR